MLELRKRTEALPDEYLVSFVGAARARLAGLGAAAVVAWRGSGQPCATRGRRCLAGGRAGRRVPRSPSDCSDPSPSPFLSAAAWTLLPAHTPRAPGDMITEEALPTYMAMLNTLDGVRDETGAAPTPWGRWTREWTAEENRHGDVMNKYMYLTGR